MKKRRVLEKGRRRRDLKEGERGDERNVVEFIREQRVMRSQEDEIC